MRKNLFLYVLIFCILSFFFNNCSKGPIVTDIVKGVYDSSKINKITKSKKIKIVTGDTLVSISKKARCTHIHTNDVECYCYQKTICRA